MRQVKFWVVGGDRRQAALANALAADGHPVTALALDRGELSDGVRRAQTTRDVGEARCVVLPLPVRGEADWLSAPLCHRPWPLAELFAHLSPTQYLCGGRVDDQTAGLAAQYGLTVHDYFRREELTVANAVPTAEGAVQIALEEMDVTLHGARVLVLGYGRVGQLTAHRFGGLGAKVTVAARRPDALAWAKAYGFAPLEMDALAERLADFDAVVNTVPSLLLTGERLELLKRSCLVIDLASKPGGVDFQRAEELGVRCVWALGLPGKVAPVTAAAAIRDTVYNMLREES